MRWNRLHEIVYTAVFAPCETLTLLYYLFLKHINQYRSIHKLQHSQSSCKTPDSRVHSSLATHKCLSRQRQNNALKKQFEGVLYEVYYGE